MNNNVDLEKLEKRVDELRKEAHELKLMIISIKREESGNSQKLNVDNSKLRISPEQNPVRQTELSPLETKERIDWEKKIGQVWLPRVFIFVLLLGVIWAFKAASDYGFLNESVKVLLGYVSAAVFIFFGYKQMLYKRNALGQVLLGGSIVLLLIVTFAMHVLYGFVPLIIAFVLNISWVLLGLYFSHRFQAQPLAVVTAIGGYLIPFLLESTSPNITNFVLFETFFYLSLLFFAVRKMYTILYQVAFIFLHLTNLVGAFLLANGELKFFAISILIQHLFLLLVLCLYELFIKHQISILFTSTILTLAWTKAAFIDSHFEGVILIIFLLYAGLAYYFWNKSNKRRGIFLSIGTVSLATLLINHFEVENILGVLLVQGLLSLYLGIVAQSTLKQVIGVILYIYSGLGIISSNYTIVLSVEFFNWILLLCSLYGVIRCIPLFSWIKDDEQRNVIRLIHIITLGLLLVFITLTVNALTTKQTINIQLMSVSSVWAIYAFGSMVIGFMKNYKPLRVFGLVLLFVTLGKLLFIDLSFISFFIRAILFIGLGVFGILGSRIFYQTKPSKSS